MITSEFTAAQAARLAALAALGAPEGAQWFTWPTASAVLDSARGVLLIATDFEPAPDDWDSVCALLELAGYDSGGPMAADPGEPVMTQGLCLWQLEVPVLVG